MAKPKSPRPRTKANRAVELGLEAHALVREDRAALEPRLTPALIEGLETDLVELGQLAPGALQERAARNASTATQTQFAAQASSLVSAMRTSVKSAGLSSATRKGWGVGTKVDTKVVKRVLASGEGVLERARSAPDEARAAGILPSDLEALSAALAALRGADDIQERKKVSAKGATRARDQAHRRIEDAVKRIAAAGALQFTGTERAATYGRLLEGAKKRQKPE